MLRKQPNLSAKLAAQCKRLIFQFYDSWQAKKENPLQVLFTRLH
ncbi:hypothetical protein RNAN_1111 [Rheinheimera nanhaiensis E407-8]|uniref:Uncharacterized protein n=1 Tax=Rheinheimera nanhaiensis E407-8 TaxID=562729 RepID=I1DVR2_9GAMM|nr:hypothetical protein RNAN_1111 [Rheinheimera nanhaiensis E407-8]